MSDPNPYASPQHPSPGSRPRMRWAFVLLALLSLPAGVIAGFATCTVTFVVSDGLNAPDGRWLIFCYLLGALVGGSVLVALLFYSVRRLRRT